MNNFRASAGVVLVINQATGSGWAATTTEPLRTGQAVRPVLWVGGTAAAGCVGGTHYCQ